MDSFFRLALRFLAIAFAYFVACLVAALAFVFLAGLIRPEDFSRLASGEMAFTMVVGTLGTAAIFGRFAMLPVFLVIAAFELSRRRDWLTHVLAGALLGAGFGAIAMSSDSNGEVFSLAIAMVCAMLAASVYWFIAGRFAGHWLPSERKKFVQNHQPAKDHGAKE